MTFAQRLEIAMQRAGMNKTQLARALEARNATVTGWLKHDAIPTGDYLMRMPGVLGVDGHWLLTGEYRGDFPQDGERTLRPVGGYELEGLRSLLVASLEIVDPSALREPEEGGEAGEGERGVA